MKRSRDKSTRVSAIAITAVICTLVIISAIFPLPEGQWGFLSVEKADEVSANPGWLTGWSYRKAHNLTGATGAGNNYTIYLTVHSGSGSDSGDTVYLGGHCTDFPNDITFTDNDETTELAHWCENLTADPATFAVTVLDSLSSNQTIYIYYGKAAQASASNGTATFLLFDDFGGSYIRYPDNPVSSPGPNAYDYRGMRQPSLYTEGSTHYLYYAGCGKDDVERYWTGCLLTSTNLTTWAKQGSKLGVGDGPLLGHDDVVASGSNGADTIVWTKYIGYHNGTMVAINIKTSGSGNVKVGIYDDNGSGTAPVNRLAYANSTAVASGWNSIPVSSVNITGGTVYWLAFNSETSLVGYKTETGNRKYISKDFSYEMPDPATEYGALSTSDGYQDLLAGWTIVSTTEDWDAKIVQFEQIYKIGSTYYGIYTGGANMNEDDKPISPWSTGIATASAPDGPWTKYGSNPVFNASANPSDWDSKWALITSVIEDPSETYNYMGFYCAQKIGTPVKIGIAYSNDLYSWVRYGSNPVLDPSDPGDVPFTSDTLENPTVFSINGTWYMTALSGPIVTESAYTHNYLWKATNADLTNWSFVGELLDAGDNAAWDAGAVSHRAVIYEGGELKVLYCANDDADPFGMEIGLMTISGWDPEINDLLWTQRTGDWWISEGRLTGKEAIDDDVVSVDTFSDCAIKSMWQREPTGTGSGNKLRVIARSADVDNAYDSERHYQSGNNLHSINELVGGEWTNLEYESSDTQDWNWHTLEFKLDGTSLKSSFDGGSDMSTTDSSHSSGKLGFMVGAHTNDYYWYAEWVCVRNYVDPEPAHGGWGDEETGGCSPSISLNTYSWSVNGGSPVAENSNYATGLTYFTITNNSGGSVTITIGGTDMTGGGYTWDLADDGNPGDMIYGMYAGLEGGDYTIIVKESTPYNTLKAGLADEGTQNFGLKIYTPTNFDDGNNKSGTIILTVVCD